MYFLASIKLITANFCENLSKFVGLVFEKKKFSYFLIRLIRKWNFHTHMENLNISETASKNHLNFLIAFLSRHYLLNTVEKTIGCARAKQLIKYI